MRVFFIRNYEMGIVKFKPGQDAELWDATDVIRNKFAVPFEERNFIKDESQTETQTAPESPTKKEGLKGKKNKNN